MPRPQCIPVAIGWCARGREKEEAGEEYDRRTRRKKRPADAFLGTFGAKLGVEKTSLWELVESLEGPPEASWAVLGTAHIASLLLYVGVSRK